MAAPQPNDIQVRYTEPEDAPFMRKWFSDPETVRWFPMYDEVEIDDAVGRWIGFSRYKCSLTAVKDGIPCGIATLYLQPYRRLAHQCEMGIVVDKNYRNMRVGETLLSALMSLAKNTFRIELLHLQVHGENPAMRIYKRFGFREFGRQTRWLKESNGTFVQRVMLERIL